LAICLPLAQTPFACGVGKHTGQTAITHHEAGTVCIVIAGSRQFPARFSLQSVAIRSQVSWLLGLSSRNQHSRKRHFLSAFLSKQGSFG
jgi:hypothetical protein